MVSVDVAPTKIVVGKNALVTVGRFRTNKVSRVATALLPTLVCKPPMAMVLV